MFRDEHMNPYTIFKRAQLLERFRLFERRWFPFHELKERLTPKSVDALVTQIQGAAVSPGAPVVPRPRDEGGKSPGGWKTAAP